MSKFYLMTFLILSLCNSYEIYAGGIDRSLRSYQYVTADPIFYDEEARRVIHQHNMQVTNERIEEAHQIMNYFNRFVTWLLNNFS